VKVFTGPHRRQDYSLIFLTPRRPCAPPTPPRPRPRSRGRWNRKAQTVVGTTTDAASAATLTGVTLHTVRRACGAPANGQQGFRSGCPDHVRRGMHEQVSSAPRGMPPHVCVARFARPSEAALAAGAAQPRLGGRKGQPAPPTASPVRRTAGGGGPAAACPSAGAGLVCRARLWRQGVEDAHADRADVARGQALGGGRRGGAQAQSAREAQRGVQAGRARGEADPGGQRRAGVGRRRDRDAACGHAGGLRQLGHQAAGPAGGAGVSASARCALLLRGRRRARLRLKARS